MAKMLTKMLEAAVLGALLVLGGHADAASIALSPSGQTVTPGASVDVDIVISGLGANVAPTLSAFDLDVSFDPSVLSFVAVTFGLDLGAPGIDAFVSGGLLGGPVRVDLAEASLLSNAVLDASQPDAFVMATLHFTALGLGTSPLAITQAVLANTAGGSIPADLTGASVDVVVPEPGAFALVALGVGGLAFARRRRPRR